MSMPSSRTRRAIASKPWPRTSSKCSLGGDRAGAAALLSSGPLDSSVTSKRAAVVAFEHLRHQLAGRVLMWKSAER